MTLHYKHHDAFVWSSFSSLDWGIEAGENNCLGVGGVCDSNILITFPLIMQVTTNTFHPQVWNHC